MTDEDIKKALECCLEGHCSKCPMVGKYSCSKSLREHALDLINRQQERIEELEIITGLANSRKYYRKFVDEVFCKQKGNELSEPDFDYIYQLYFEQQAEIERLTRLLDQWKKVACKYIDSIENIKSEAIKEFAERVRKEVANTWFGVCCTSETEEYKEGCLFGLVAKQKHCISVINNLLAEMVGEQNARDTFQR